MPYRTFDDKSRRLLHLRCGGLNEGPVDLWQPDDYPMVLAINERLGTPAIRPIGARGVRFL